MIAEVPSCIGLSTEMSTCAWPLSVSLTSSTLPTGAPPIRTWLPLTSWPPVSNSSR